MKTSITAIAAMLAAASFAGSALADGDYFEGVSKTPVSSTSAQVDTVRTGSVGQFRVNQDNGNQPIFQHESRDNR